MKKVISLLLAAVMVVSMFAGLQISSSALATNGKCGDNVYWSFDESTGTLTISGTGVMGDYEIENSPFFQQSDIKTVIIESGVTSIGEWVFEECEHLTSITIPDTVTSIGNCAFYNCSGLTSITIPNSVNSIGKSVLRGCDSLQNITVVAGNSVFDSRNNCNAIIETQTNTLISGCKTTIIPDSVTSIGDSAFYNCEDLTSITIPASVTSIGDSAFFGCSALTSITIPNSITSIGKEAFSNCNGLTSINIPDSVKSIGDEAFFSCNGLISINIPDSVVSIGASAFSHCVKLASVTMGKFIEIIGNYAFSDCEELASITLPDSVKSVGFNVFNGTSYYNNSANWEDDILYIGNHFIKAKDTFSGAYTIKSGTKTIAGYAFINCSNLTSITIPDSVLSIGDYAFYGCIGLASVDIPDSVTSIGKYAFYECSNLTSITIPDSVTSIGEYAFYNTTYYKNSANWDNDVFYIGNYLIKAKNTLSGAYTIKSGTKIIADYAFYNCSKLTSIDIPNSLTGIGSYAFCDCSALTSITIPDSVTSIDECAFWNCHALNEIHYSGTQGQWNSINIKGYNEPLTSATLHIVAPHIHSYTNVVTPPTCTAKGFTTHTCACGDSYKDTYVKALGHKWDAGKVTKKATPTATGIKTYTCKVCKAKKTATIAKCAKYKNTLSVKGKKVTVKYSKLKKANQTIARNSVLTISKAQGKLTYAKVSGNKNIGISKSKGIIQVKKGLKKGTYKIGVKVTAAGNASYKSASKTATITVVVK